MRIHAPRDDDEFVDVIGGLKEEELVVVERLLATDAPDIRFVRVQDENWIPSVRRYTIKVHREDRERFSVLVFAMLGVLTPMLFQPRVVAEELEVAAQVRHYVRAIEADDSTAWGVTRDRKSTRLNSSH